MVGKRNENQEINFKEKHETLINLLIIHLKIMFCWFESIHLLKFLNYSKVIIAPKKSPTF